MMNNIWFTSDHHFGHKNVIEYCNRPFTDIYSMDGALIDRWNSVVDVDDIVYHLGDFTLGDRKLAVQFFGKLNGKVKILNTSWHHDKRWINSMFPYYTSGGEVEIISSIEILKLSGTVLDGTVLVLCHYPFEEWDRKHYGSIHLHGHSHGNLKVVKNRIDVGVDNWNFYPISLDQILERNIE